MFVPMYMFRVSTRLNSTDRHQRLCLRLLWPWPLAFWPQSLIITSLNPNTSATKTGNWNSLHWLWDVVFTRTHRRTDTPKNSTPPASNDDGRCR